MRNLRLPRFAIAATTAASLFLGLGAGSAGAEATISPAQLQEIQRLTQIPPFQHGTWGLLAVDADSGTPLLERNVGRTFLAASTTKNFSGAATLGELGAGYRFHTPVVRLGAVRDGTLRGDLVLQASGDLTLGGRALPNGKVAYTGFDHTDANEVPGPATLTPQDPLAGLDRLARQVRAAGIRRVAGDVVIDDRLWRAQRIGKEVISPIVVNDNMIDVTLIPTRPGQPVKAKIRPRNKAYTIRVNTRTGAPGSPVAPEVGKPRDGRFTIGGTIPAGGTPVVQVARVPDPAFFARTLFVEALDRAGVAVEAPTVADNLAGELPPFASVAKQPRVAQLTSPPVSEFVKLILKVSHNLGANTEPFWIAVHRGGPHTFRAGMQAIRAYAARAGVPAGQAVLTDGQGLPGNKISPLAMVALLRYVKQQPYGETFREALPVKGVDGLPENPEQDPGTGHVFAKNGLLGGLGPDDKPIVEAMALAGYAGTGPDQIAFDVVVNDVPILPNGKSSLDPDKLVAAFTRFGPLEGITTQLYLASAGDSETR
ncbi:MAG TPA: D-alanyl-D-alanine carboxypeptidase/D-alanyl-D-alanine-endopeptidase [Solirubrobacterales bacterium]|nr:D-alanyl-D-alanine carboxypeptidase/D-alanyl-D-alanine-endopeptidase [Solirubrobacterales bacterium]